MNIKIIITSCMLAALSACGGGSSTPADNGPPPVSNTAPVANPGTAQSVVAGMPVMLDGSASSDANGDALTYAWALSTKPAGSAAVLVAATTAKPTFTADVAGTYVLTLTVNDGKAGSAPVSVTVTAAAGNAAPVANAGPAQTVLTGTRVMLDGRASSDANGDVLTFAWVLTSKPSGSNTTLSGTTLAQPAFTPDVAGTYVATLIVGDGKLTSTGATVSVTVTQANIAPVANAGVAQTIMTGAVATLDGSGSSDANGDALSYAWVLTSRPANSSAVLTSATSARPTFTADMTGVYVATLRVNDGKLDSVAATVTITATSSGINRAPVASAGPSQDIRSPIGIVTLDGSASYDADGDPLTYKWTLVSSPTPTRVPFNSTTLPVATLAPASGEGVYVVSLVVNDGKVDSAPSITTVNSANNVSNLVPFANAGPAQFLVPNSTVRLSGLGSTDRDGDQLTYKWYLKSRPSGSNAVLSSFTWAETTFVADIAGTYVATLIVNDGKMNSSESNVTITARLNTPALFIYQAGSPYRNGYVPVNLPYVDNATQQRSCIESCASNFTVASFQLIAAGSNFTIKNLIARDSTGTIVPSFGNLREGQAIAAESTTLFDLLAPKTGGANTKLTYQFTISETGQTFVYNVNFVTN